MNADRLISRLLRRMLRLVARRGTRAPGAADLKTGGGDRRETRGRSTATRTAKIKPGPGRRSHRD